jgi:hypothetical protein
MNIRCKHAELAEGLVARDHGAAQRSAGGVAEEAPEDVEEALGSLQVAGGGKTI